MTSLLCQTSARSVSVQHERDGLKDYSYVTVEKVSEEEMSQVEVVKTGSQTVIEEVITRVEETEREVIEEQSICEFRLYHCRYMVTVGIEM